MEPASAAELLRLALTLAGERSCDAVDAIGGERVGVVAHHLFQPRARQGAFLPLQSISEGQVTKAYRDLLKQNRTEESEETEGVVRELQFP
jgi:hypothetical protein